MSKDTILYDADPEKEDPRKQEETGDSQRENIESPDSEKNKVNYLKIGGASALGLAGGVLGSHLAFSRSPVINTEESDTAADILVNERLPIAKDVNDQMSFEEAFQAARDEIGTGGLFSWNGSYYGTYTESEWNDLSQDEQGEFWGSFSINPYHTEEHSESPAQEPGDSAFASHDFGSLAMAQSVHDDMTFGEAFAAARMEHGPNAVFEWKGNVYGTYYKEEWETMPQDTREEFSYAALQLSQGQENQLAANDSMYVGSEAPGDQEAFLADNEVYEAEVDPEQYGQDHGVEYLDHPDPAANDLIDLDFAQDFIPSAVPDALDIREASAYFSPAFDDAVLSETNLADIENMLEGDDFGSADQGEVPLNITGEPGIGPDATAGILNKAFQIGNDIDDINDLIEGDLKGLDMDDSLFSL